MAVKGLAGVHQKAQELSAQRQAMGGLRRFTPEFRWDGSKPPQENALNLRILGDDLIVPTKMHRGVPLPENKFFFGVCRKADPVNDTSCYVCDTLAEKFDGDAKQKKRNGLVPVDVAVGLAVEMEAVLKNGRVFDHWKPKLIEYQIPELTSAEKNNEASEQDKEYRKLLNGLGKPGDKVNIPNVGLMIGTISGQQALWDYATRRPKISDRVFEISRHGNKLDTKWDWNHEGPDAEPDPTALFEEFRLKFPFEIPEEWVARSASQSRYDSAFKLGGNTSSSEEDDSSSSSSDDVEEPVADSRAALMERLKGRS